MLMIFGPGDGYQVYVRHIVLSIMDVEYHLFSLE
jgi:hypothetical protein